MPLKLATDTGTGCRTAEHQPRNTVPEDEEIRGEIKMSLPLVQISLNMCTFANK